MTVFDIVRVRLCHGFWLRLSSVFCALGAVCVWSFSSYQLATVISLTSFSLLISFYAIGYIYIYIATRAQGLYVPKLKVTQVQLQAWDVHVGYLQPWGFAKLG